MFMNLDGYFMDFGTLFLIDLKYTCVSWILMDSCWICDLFFCLVDCDCLLVDFDGLLIFMDVPRFHACSWVIEVIWS